MINKQISAYLGNCGTKFAESQILDLVTYGEIVAAIAFILAFMQFSSPIWQFRISASWKFNTIFYTFFAIAVGCTFASKVIPLCTSNYNCLINCFQLVAAVIIPCIMGGMLWIVSSPTKLSKCNAKRYYEACKKLIQGGNDKELIQIGKELTYSLDAIVLGNIGVNKKKAKERLEYHKKHNKMPEEADFTQNVRKITALLSDSLFCKVLIKYDSSFIEEFFKKLEEDKLYALPEDEVPFFLTAITQEIIRQALTEPNSLFYREIQQSFGVGYERTLSQIFFGNFKFVESSFNVLSHDTLFPPTISDVRIYEKILSLLIPAYFKDKNNFQTVPNSVENLFEKINSLATRNIAALQKIENDQFLHCQALESLTQIFILYVGNIGALSHLSEEVINEDDSLLPLCKVTIKAIFDLITLIYTEDEEKPLLLLSSILITLIYTKNNNFSSFYKKIQSYFDELAANFLKSDSSNKEVEVSLFTKPMSLILIMFGNTKTYNMTNLIKLFADFFNEQYLKNTPEEFQKLLPSYVAYDQGKKILINNKSANFLQF